MYSRVISIRHQYVLGVDIFLRVFHQVYPEQNTNMWITLYACG